MNILFTFLQTNILIFPEITNIDSDDKSLNPFRKAAFHISNQSNTKILPVVVQPYTFLDKRNKVFSRGEVTVKILAPVVKNWYESLEDFTLRCYEMMNDQICTMTELT